MINGRKTVNLFFFEGPPTANGKPGIHHVLARTFKDIICRYKTMQGFRVERKAGWDTHGLPVELEVQKKLGLTNKKDIENYGIAEFNKKCKESVWEYKSDWEKLTERIAFWVDMKNPYITYENNYIESVWWIVKQIADKGLLYKDYKVVQYCPKCETVLSSHEVAQGYQNIKENSIYVKFKVLNQENTYFLVWTTTPWTLPGNVALAIGKDIDYSLVKIKDGDDYYILACLIILAITVFAFLPSVRASLTRSFSTRIFSASFFFRATRADFAFLFSAMIIRSFLFSSTRAALSLFLTTRTFPASFRLSSIMTVFAFLI